MASAAERETTGALFRYLLSVSRRGGWLLVLTLAISAVSGVLSVLPFYGLFRLISTLLEGGAGQEALSRWGFFILYSAAGQILVYALSMVFSHVTAYRILRDLRYALARKLLDIPLGWFTKQTSGDTRKLFTEDVEKIELFIAHHIPDITRAVATPATTFILLLSADWRLAVVSLIPLLLSPVFLVSVFRHYDRNMAEYYRLLARMNGTIIEYIRGMGVVRAFNRTASSFGNYRTSVNEYFEFWKNWTIRAMNGYGGFFTTLESGSLFILGIGGPLYLTGAITAPAFLITLILGPAYVSAFRLLFFMTNIMSMNLRGVSRLRAVLETPPLPEPWDAIVPAGEGIDFSKVCFGYDSAQVVSNLEFEARPGTITAFAGPSGAGKTTAALLAARFYDPTSGTIRMGKAPYPSVGTREILRRVSICFQESQLFRGTIEENIRMGNRTAPFADVERAARAARAHDFIAALPDGYSTVLSGDRSLSGGQVQRIAIARAILKNSPVVILDEATSYADPENERLIQEALNELLADRTVIVVAHRLKTLAHVDNILVFDDGRIVEQGRFDDLIAAGGTFARLWEGALAALEWNIADARGRTA
jgi:ATP-binding cassette subfamily B protein IrtA